MLPTSGILLPELKLRLYILHTKYFLVLQYFNVKTAHKRCFLNKNKKFNLLCEFSKVKLLYSSGFLLIFF